MLLARGVRLKWPAANVASVFEYSAGRFRRSGIRLIVLFL